MKQIQTIRSPFWLSKIVFLSIIFLIITQENKAQNPISPEGVYIADPTARVWNDGKMYVYGSRDESLDYYCSNSYRVLSSKDLSTWSLTGTSFASKGKNDEVAYSDQRLYAPDIEFFDNKYYLYYCLPSLLVNGYSCEGVATSNSPEGPFKNGQPIDIGKHNEIDPAVFVDDDGQAYYIWGQFTAKMAKLNPNRVSIDLESVKENVLTEKDHFFHEGVFMTKRNGLYYLVYADVSRGGAPTSIGYATSKSPMGPYTYGGVIIDNKYCDPAVWNNHGSITQFKDKWYVFYHRSTNNSVKMRKACVEPITFREDGSIIEAQMTSQGAGLPLNALETIDARRACMLLGNVRISTLKEGNEVLDGFQNGDKAFFKYLDFKDGAQTISIKVAPGQKPFKIIVSIDSFTKLDLGTTIATIDVPKRVDDEWITLKVPIKKTTGIHALRISVNENKQTPKDQNPASELCKIDSFQFN